MPPLGSRSPDRKSLKLTIPISEEVNSLLESMAAKHGKTKTEFSRAILVKALNES